MKVSCPSCQTNYNIDDKRIPPGGAKLKCANCQTTFPIKPQPAEAPAAIPLPGAPSGTAPAQGAIPLPGSSSAIPLPAPPQQGASSSGAAAIPLPGAAPYPDSTAEAGNAFDTPTRPRTSPEQRWDTESTRVFTYPPPGGQAQAPGAIPLPGGGTAPEPDAGSREQPWDSESTRVMSIPLPSAAFNSPPPPVPAEDLGFADPGAVPLPGGGAAPLLGDDPLTDPGSPGVSAGDAALLNAPTRPRSMDLDGPSIPLPGSEDPSGFSDPSPDVPFESAEDDFSDVSADLGAPPRQQAIAPPPPHSHDLTTPDAAVPLPPSGAPLDFDDLPAPPAAASPDDVSFDFAELPQPPGAPSGDPLMDFEAPPPPADTDFNLDFAEAPPPPGSAPPPAPATPPPEDIGFGEVDFVDPSPSAPPPARSTAADPLEFDPSASGSGEKDDLEADLSAPLPPPSAPTSADGLEMLSFIDDAAKGSSASSKSKVKRYHVRRRSGKVFGPFEEGVVVKMLEDGQLLGNEDVSTDGDNWAGMSSVSAFAQAIQKLMESPAQQAGGAPGAEPAVAAATAPAQAAQTMDRLRQLYEGRMAAVAVVDRRESSEKLRKKLPVYIGAGAGALVLLICLSPGFTRYGVFWHNKLLPASLSSSSPKYADLQNARKALLADTFKSYKEARDLTGKILADKEYPEVRAVWCQAIYYLQRRYAAATAPELAEANAALDRIELLGMKNVEVAKAFTGSALARRAPADALPLVQEAKSRAENDKDVELNLLLAEALDQKRDLKGAKDVLNKVISRDKGNAKALHALGNLLQEENDANAAAKAYRQALEADPNHVSSAVELAAVELLVRKNVDEGAKAVDRALEEKVRALLGPAELARARTLKGVVLASRFQLKEAVAEFDQAVKLDPGSVFTKAMMGRVLLAQRDYDKALPLLKEAQERDPKLEYIEGYLTALLAKGKIQDALSVVNAANGRFPGNARIAYLAGRVTEETDGSGDAENQYKRAIKADPKLFEPNLALARLYLRQRRLSDAKAQMDQAMAKAPDDAGVRAGMGELDLAEHDVARAEEEFNKSVTLNPNLAEAHLGLSKVALSKGDLDTARKEVDKALELDGRVQDGRLQRGQVLWKQGQLDPAIAELELAKKADPKSTQVAIAMGAVKLDKGDLGAAETSLMTALGAETTNPEPYYYLAQVKAKQAEYTQAIESMKSALEHAPNRPDYHFTMGNILRDAKRVPEAIDEWKATLKLDPHHADADEALGQAYLDQSDMDGAVSYFEKALAADPKRTRVLGSIGDCFFQQARWKEAISRYKEALKADSSLVTLYYKLGRAFTEQGKHAEAINWYQKATAEDKTNPMPYYYLGYAYKDKGKRKEAVDSFKKYLELKPNAEDKKEIEDEIYDLGQ